MILLYDKNGLIILIFKKKFSLDYNLIDNYQCIKILKT